MKDWVAWHRDYDDPTSGLARRLAIVQGHIVRYVDASPLPAIRVVSMCAGAGRDVIGALSGHPRRAIVHGRLVELDPNLAAEARAGATAAGLALDVVEGDAGWSDAYAGAVPADLVLVCGVFGNVPDADIERTVRALPMFLALGATVIWTRKRRSPDLTPAIREWFAETGFAEVAFDPVPDHEASVGVHRLVGLPRAFEPGVRLFAFT